MKTLSNNVNDCLNQISNQENVEFIKNTITGNIPKYNDIPNFKLDFKTFEDDYFIREIYTHFCSWCIVDDEWISEIAKICKNKKCIEIMAGNGLISHALQIHGIDIRPYDNFSWESLTKYTTVYEMDAIECAEKLDYDYIICSWPPYESTDICMVLKKMYYKNPKSKLIYIGEYQGGCTACDKFFDMVDIIDRGHESKIINKANEYFKRFYGINDYIILMRPNDKCKNYYE